MHFSAMHCFSAAALAAGALSSCGIPESTDRDAHVSARASASAKAIAPTRHGPRPPYLPVHRPAAGEPMEPNSWMQYHGGPTVSYPAVHFIFYGDWRTHKEGPPPTTVEGNDAWPHLRDFVNGLSGSPYYRINTTYNAAPAGPLSHLTDHRRR
jgi:hypothetical protein